MIASISITDPAAALMLARLRVDELGRAYAGRHDSRHDSRRDSRIRLRDRFRRHARPRRALA